jgi:hypothetical protein
MHGNDTWEAKKFIVFIFTLDMLVERLCSEQHIMHSYTEGVQRHDFWFTPCLDLQVSSQWPGLPAGVKFEPTDQELLMHLEGKVGRAASHVLIDDFIPTIEEVDGICYTHPKNLPGTRFLFFSCHQDLLN